jgi:hypothetical protein
MDVNSLLASLDIAMPSRRSKIALRGELATVASASCLRGTFAFVAQEKAEMR